MAQEGIASVSSDSMALYKSCIIIIRIDFGGDPDSFVDFGYGIHIHWDHVVYLQGSHWS